MGKYSIAADTIKSSISALDVASVLGWEVKRGRCKCPIHNGGDFNCVLYSGSRGFYCHTCKAGGDVIYLVQSVLFGNENHKNGFVHCIAWFNATFHLGLDLDGQIDPQKQRQAEIALQRRKKTIEFEEWKGRMKFDLALDAGTLVRNLEKQREENLPRSPDEVWNERFCEAIELLPEARRFEDECWMNCTEVRKNG